MHGCARVRCTLAWVCTLVHPPCVHLRVPQGMCPPTELQPIWGRRWCLLGQGSCPGTGSVVGERRQHTGIRDSHSGYGEGPPTAPGGMPPASSPHTSARGYKPALRGRPFLPGRKADRSCWCPGSGVRSLPPSPALSVTPRGNTHHGAVLHQFCSLCQCRPRAPAANTRRPWCPLPWLTLGPGGPADPRCPA